MNLEIYKFKLLNVLKENSIKRTKLSTTGKLVPSRLAHYKTSKLLFSQPIPNTGKKYKCEIILDISGSMSGNRIIKAIKSVKNLIKLFHGVIDFKITGVGAGTIPLSLNKILSIDENVPDFDMRKHFSRGMSVKTYGGVKNLIPFEGGEYNIMTGTWIVGAVAQAGFNLIEEDGERFIVILTDGKEFMDEFGNTTKGRDLKYYLDEVNGVDVLKYGPENHKTMAEGFKSEGINILPIGIGTDTLSEYYDDYINLNNPDDIYENVINFISKNFG